MQWSHEVPWKPYRSRCNIYIYICMGTQGFDWNMESETRPKIKDINRFPAIYIYIFCKSRVQRYQLSGPRSAFFSFGLNRFPWAQVQWMLPAGVWGPYSHVTGSSQQKAVFSWNHMLSKTCKKVSRFPEKKTYPPKPPSGWDSSVSKTWGFSGLHLAYLSLCLGFSSQSGSLVTCVAEWTFAEYQRFKDLQKWYCWVKPYKTIMLIMIMREESHKK